MESITIEGAVMHKNCLRCAHCNGLLSAGKYAAVSGKFFCKPHFKQLFALKGNYTDGFSDSNPTSPVSTTSETGDGAL